MQDGQVNKKKNAAQKEVTRKANAPTCAHNSWDNVRVIKGQVTLRCRECQAQWRTIVDGAWRRSKCGLFNSPAGCTDAACEKLHVHAKKQSLVERVDNHGTHLLTHLPADVIPAEVAEACAVPPAALSSLCVESRVSCFARSCVPSAANSHFDGSDLSRRGSAACSSHVPETDCCSVSASTAGNRNAPRVSYTKPCAHNRWENVRVKKGLVTLRCRECQQQWRQVSGTLNKCPDFPRCPNASSCEMLHVHSSKKSILEYEQIAAESQKSGDMEHEGISIEVASSMCTDKFAEIRWCDEDLDTPLPSFDTFVTQQRSSFGGSGADPAPASECSDVASVSADDFYIPTRVLTPLSYTADEESAFEPAFGGLNRANTCFAQLHF
eukprot:gene15776-24096_t